MVAERASGIRSAELFKAQLLYPVGLTRTAVDDMADVVAGRATGYEPAAAAAGGFRNTLPASLAWPGGAGSMRSTTDDLCRWHHRLLGGHILRAQSLALMLTPVRLADGTLPPRPVNAPPGLTGQLRYGLGIRMETENGRELISHTSGFEGFLTELTSYPRQRVTVAVMTNSGRIDNGANSNEDALRAVLREAARIALS